MNVLGRCVIRSVAHCECVNAQEKPNVNKCKFTLTSGLAQSVVLHSLSIPCPSVDVGLPSRLNRIEYGEPDDNGGGGGASTLPSLFSHPLNVG